ncbi:MAG TPA: hypothetical protein VNZ05_08165, partial [Solirubrobacteraceae bacterium]|nr:hypothetical protein [Solirubrobacteraceae bacterium]
AGILLALAAATYALLTRRARAALVLGVPPVALAAALAALFPEGGSEPYPFTSLLATLAVVGAFLLALPRSQRTLRRGAAVYTLACVACVAIATPMGSNIERYGVLLAGPLLVCAWLAERRSPMRTAVLASALCGWGVWVAWGPVRETRAVSHNESTRSSYYAPVERFLATQPGPVRVEVPLTRSHWEAALLAPRVSLARGWEKQLDESYDRVVLASHPSAAGYARWLRESAVSFVALPDTPLDGSSVGEGRLIRAGLPYLREVSSSAHWRIYAVLGSEPLLGGPGRLTSLGHDAFAVQAYAPGRLLVRVRFGRYLAIANGSGCVRRAPGGWTYVTVRMPETLAVQARFTLARALGLEGTCTGA